MTHNTSDEKKDPRKEWLDTNMNLHMDMLARSSNMLYMTAPKTVEALVNKLRLVANMINLGEKIRWGQETTLMDEAADALETLHHQLQKARHDWLREEIVRLEGMKERAQFGRETSWEIEHANGHNKALQTILDRYQSELDQDNK